jgi:hypothetical protein
MKKRILILAILMLILSISYAKSPESVLQQTINSQIQFPAFALDKQIEGTVFVEFTIKEDGRIEVINCSSLQGELQSFVFLKLASLTVNPDPKLMGQNFLMRFDFKLI